MDSFIFISTNLSGLRKNCVFVDIWFGGLPKSAYRKCVLCWTIKIMVYHYPCNPQKMVSTEKLMNPQLTIMPCSMKVENGSIFLWERRMLFFILLVLQENMYLLLYQWRVEISMHPLYFVVCIVLSLIWKIEHFSEIISFPIEIYL